MGGPEVEGGEVGEDDAAGEGGDEEGGERGLQVEEVCAQRGDAGVLGEGFAAHGGEAEVHVGEDAVLEGGEGRGDLLLGALQQREAGEVRGRWRAGEGGGEGGRRRMRDDNWR